jgi:NAD(P)-dependent dehydrogenase (short-subunit alcohol dehydrogenase family)
MSVNQRVAIVTGSSSGIGLDTYVSTKFAFEGLTELISYELESFGIKVVLIEPGLIRTNFANAMILTRKRRIQIHHIQ